MRARRPEEGRIDDRSVVQAGRRRRVRFAGGARPLWPARFLTLGDGAR